MREAVCARLPELIVLAAAYALLLTATLETRCSVVEGSRTAAVREPKTTVAREPHASSSAHIFALTMLLSI